MYRCFGCDTPPALGHVSGCIMAANRRVDVEQPAANQQQDPWGWEDSPVKVDIQSGLKVNAREAIAA
jgi:hypothetical protein